RSLKRFKVDAGADADHRLELECSETMLVSRWYTATRSKGDRRYRRMGESSREFVAKAERDYPSTARLVVRDILGELPWDGEVVGSGAKVPPEAKLEDLKLSTQLPKGWKKTYVVTSLGYGNTDSVAHCMGIEVGQVDPKKISPFNAKAYGIIV